MTPPALADRADREQIATALDDTLIVEAAAGTGKTTELVRRIVRVIQTGRAEVTEIVAVTFTEKAAGELKLRLREALEEARGGSVSESAERDRLDRALGRLEEAEVSTIHGFCADLLRERPVEARIDPLFMVLTEAQAARMYDDGFHQWLESELADPSEGVKRSLRRPIFGGFGAQWTTAMAPIDRLRRAGWELIQWRDFDGDWQRPPFDRSSRVDELVQLLNGFTELSEPPVSANDTLYPDTRRRGSSRKTSFAPRRSRRATTAGSRGPHRARQEPPVSKARKGSGKQYRPGVPARMSDHARGPASRADPFRDRCERRSRRALARRAARLVSAYEAAKAKAGALDFLDLLLKARNLVRDDSGVRRSFQQRFKRLFVDEFQDTDPLQAEILLLLAADDPAARMA